MIKKQSLINSVLGLHCPRCRKGHLFKKRGLIRYTEILEMPDKCEVCGLTYEIENGFWIGAMWISYPLVVAIELPFLILALFADSFYTWVYFTSMVLAFLLFWPLILRLGRSLWIHVNVRFDKDV